VSAWGVIFRQQPALFEDYKVRFQQLRAARQSTPPPASAAPKPVTPGRAVPSTAVLMRRISLGDHAAMTAELDAYPAEKVRIYAKYGLSDPDIRAAVLAMSEEDLKNPARREAWERQRKLAREGLGPSRSTPPPKSASIPLGATAAAAAQEGTGVLPPTNLRVAHQMSLGEHAQFVAECEHFPKEEVYAKYELTDPDLREAILRMAESRLNNPGTKEQWDRQYKAAKWAIQDRLKAGKK
jgi:hypothetical protein